MLRLHDHHELSALLDYVDAPAQEVLDRTARTQAQRLSDETRAELDKVLRRVENIYGSFEMMDQAVAQQTAGSNVEYVNDLLELEEILKDNLKKKKYQQQVTIFVVGFENVCSTRLRLIQQVNEFFMDSSSALAADIPEEPTDVEDSDKEEAFFDGLNTQMEASIEACHQLSDRLAEVNSEMMEFMAAYAQSKMSNKKQSRAAGGKKKLEKALETARAEMTHLSDKLLSAQEELKEKEERIQQLYKQMEMKNIECQKYKTAAEAMKRSVMESEAMKASLAQRELDVRRLQSKVSELSLEIQENEEVSELDNERQREAGQMSQQKLNHLESRLQSKSLEMAETQRDIIGEMMEMQRRFEEQMEALRQEHKVEVEAMKREHEAEVKVLKDGAASPGPDPAARAGSASPSSPSSPASRAGSHGGDSHDSQFDENAVTKWMSDDEEENVYKSKAGSKPEFPKSRASTIKEPSRLGKDSAKSPKHSALNESDVVEFADEFALDDESAWSSVPRSHVIGRFKQYRMLSESVRSATVDRLDAVKKVTDRKVQTLKGQFQEHKARWIKEREILLRAIQSSENHREVAQDFAEKAVDQMETMIATAEAQESMASLAEPSERESVMKARVSVLEIANAELQEKVERTEEIAHNLEAQLYEVQRPRTTEDKLAATDFERDSARSHSTRSKKVTITSAYEDRATPGLEASASLLPRQASSSLDSISTMSAVRLEVGVAEGYSFHTVDTVFEERESAHTEEEGRIKTGGTRQSSGLSSRLSEAKQAAAESRQGLAQSAKSAQSRAAAVSASQRLSGSVAEDAVLDENADMPFPPDPKGWPVEERATAMSTASSLLRKEIPLADHPIVQEYVRTYDHLMEFKEKLSSLLQDKDLMSAAADLSEMEALTLEKDSHIAPQVEAMGRSIVMVLDQTLLLVRHMLTSSDDLPVSSLRLSESTLAAESQRAASRTTAQTLPPVGEASAEAERLRAELDELRAQYAELKEQFDVSNKKYEHQLNQNTSIMVEMQGTIANLKRELTSLNVESQEPAAPATEREVAHSRARSDVAVSAVPSMPVPEPSIIFTRLDFERNSRSLKRAVNEARLDAESYQEALQKMEEYTRIPVQRLGFIVRKYLHHHTMLRIQENARRHKSLSTEVFQLWDNMELMEAKRQQRYAETADFLAQERVRLAQELVDAFEAIEERCSIFLVKPVLSLRSREQLQDYYAAMMRMKETEQRQRRAQEEAERKRRAMAGVHPTPEVTRVSMGREMPSHVRGSGLKEAPLPPPATFWSPMTAVNGQNYLSDSLTTINTPRLLEMDVNRILLGQNNVSVQLAGPMASNTQPQMSVRTYISVARPSSQPKMAYMYDVNLNEREKLDSAGKMHTQKVPPSTPLDRRAARSAGSGQGRLSRSSKDLSGHAPLPPITPTPRPEEEEEAPADEEEVEEKAAEEPADEVTIQEQAEEEERDEEEEEKEEEEEEEEPRAQSRILSVSVSPRTQPISSVAGDEEDADSFLPSSRSETSHE